MEQSVREQDPLAIVCENCGQPTTFNIYRQSYDCPACGASQGIGPSAQKIAAWREQHYAQLKQQEASIRGKVAFCHCASCGADVVYPAGEVTATCEFCGSRNLAPEFTKQRRFPEQILPFYITKEEAKARLHEWCAKHKNTPEAQAMVPHIEDIKGYYLPYERARGEVAFDAKVEGLGTYPYPVAGVLDGVAINMSQQMDNRLLEAMEPFIWTDIRPFEFAYMADTPTKLSDAAAWEAADRLDKEVAAIYEPQVQKALKTPNVDLAMTHKDVIGLSVLLPVYYFKKDDLEIAVNGQTGRVAVTAHRNHKDRTIWIAPWVLLILSLIPVILAYGFNFQAIFTFGFVFAAVIFVVFSQVRKSKDKVAYAKGKPVIARREGQALQYAPLKETPELLSPPHFFIPYGEKRLPAEIRFYNTRRFKKNATIFALILFFPLLASFVITLLRAVITGNFALFSDVHWSYGLGWIGILSPLIVGLGLKYGRTHLFMFPEVHYTLPNGEKVVETPNFDASVADPDDASSKKAFGCITIGLIFLMLGLVAAMLMT